MELDPPFSKAIYEKHGDAFRPWEEEDFSRTMSSLSDHLPNVDFTVCVSICFCSSFDVIVFVPTIPKNILGTLQFECTQNIFRDRGYKSLVHHNVVLCLVVSSQ